MSVSLREVIEAGGYDLNLLEDAQWLLATESEYNELLDAAQEKVDEAEALADAEAEAEYQARFGDE